jgi:hypothetical protein
MGETSRAWTGVPVVRCRIDGDEESEAGTLRYVPAAEFDLWRHLMETRPGREVTVDALSIWVPEEPSRWNSGYAPDDLEPVLRLRLDLPGRYGVPLTVERFFPAETYPRAQEALLSHYRGRSRPLRVEASAGYFVPPPSRRVADSLVER